MQLVDLNPHDPEVVNVFSDIDRLINSLYPVATAQSLSLEELAEPNVYAIGFSLGALVCYEIISSLDKELGAIFPISGFINNKINLNIAQKNTPIIIGHGINDSIVPPERSEEAYQQLSKQTSNVEFMKYDAQHNIPIKMLTKIAQIIEK